MTTCLLTKIRQRFPRPRVEDVERTVREQATLAGVSIPPDGEIALAVGSRGIDNLALMVRTLVEWVRQQGGHPFIVPAMGSHGGATAEGQAQLLASYGVTEGAMNCPIRSSMEVVSLPDEGLGHPLWMDRHAWNSDGVILLNRIKPHTDFHGTHESGLVKMSVIGLGKEKQAFEMHRHGVRGLKEMVPQAGRRVLATGKILFGLAVVENGYDETALIEGIPADQIYDREPALLEKAAAWMPRLPVDDIDLLLVDRMGKNLSGAGLDTNIIGRIMIRGMPDPATPRIKSIVVSDLTEESHGNATGIGLADIVTQRLRDKIDFAVTYKNIITSGFFERGKLPMVAETDQRAFELGLRGAGVLREQDARVVRIQDTLHLGEALVSQSVLEELKSREGIEVVGGPGAMFDAAGALLPF